MLRSLFNRFPSIRPQATMMLIGLAVASPHAWATHVWQDTQESGEPDAARVLMERALNEVPGAPIDLGLPPGVDADRLEPHDPTDPRASLELEPAVRQIATQAFLEVTTSFAPPDAEELRLAQQQYLEAREAYLDGEYFEALLMLDRAQRLDPGSTAIVRLMARCYEETTGQSKAIAYYRRLLELEPHDPEAALRVGLAEAQRRDWTEAVEMLGGLVLAHGHDGDPTTASARAVAARSLGDALSELGYDRAAAFAWAEAVRFPDPSLAPDLFRREVRRLHRERGDLYVDMGDAFVRTGHYDDAMAAYDMASTLPLIDPGSLLPRLVYVQLQQGRQYTAMLTTWRALTEMPDSPYGLQLVSYLAEAPERELLAEAILSQSQGRMESVRMVQAAASLMPDSAGTDLARTYLLNHVHDEGGLHDLLAWNVREGRVGAALELMMHVAEAWGVSPGPMVGHLAALTGKPRDLTDAWQDDVDPVLQTSQSGQLVLAKLHMAASNLADAREVLDALIANHPDDVPAQIARIELYQMMGWGDHARAALRQILNEVITTPEDVYEVVRLCMRIGVSWGGDAALELLDELADRNQDPQNADPAFDAKVHRHRTAEVYLFQGRRDDAADLLERALLVSQFDEDAYAILLRMYGPDGGLNGDPEQFADIARRLIENLPDTRTYRMLRAQQDSLTDRRDRAIEGFRSLVESDITDSQALQGLIREWILNGQTADAMRFLEDTLEQRPGDRRVRDLLVDVMIHDGRSMEALARLRSTLDENPQDFPTSRKLERVLRELDRPDEADAVAMARLEMMPQSVYRALSMARMMIQKGEATQAMVVLSEGAAQAENDLELHLEDLVEVAVQASYLGAADTAHPFVLEQIETARQNGIEPSYPVELAYLDALVRTNVELNELRLAVDATLSRFPNAPHDILDIVRDACERSNRPADATALIDPWLESRDTIQVSAIQLVTWRLRRTVLDTEPEVASSLVRKIAKSGLLAQIPIFDRPDDLADGLYQMSQGFGYGADEASEMLLLEALEENPTHAMANNNLAYAWTEKGVRLDQAERMLLIAYQRDQSSAVLDSLGWVKYKQGHFEDRGEDPEDRGAISFLLDASLDRDGRDDPVILDHLGDAYYRSGNPAQAKVWWEKAIEKYRFQLEAAKALDPQGRMEAQARELYEPVAASARSKLDAMAAGDVPPTASCPALDDDVTNGPSVPNP